MRPLRVYVAGSSKERERVEWAMGVVRESGAELTHDWLAVMDAAGPDELCDHRTLRAAAQDDIKGIDAADVVWFLVPKTPSTGAWFEVGYAFARFDRGLKIMAPGDEPFPLFVHLLGQWDDESAAGYLRRHGKSGPTWRAD